MTERLPFEDRGVELAGRGALSLADRDVLLLVNRSMF